MLFGLSYGSFVRSNGYFVYQEKEALMKIQRFFFFLRQLILSAGCISLVMISSVSWAAEPTQSVPPISHPGSVVVPGYGPGVAGHILLSPSLPICPAPGQPNSSCVKPYVDAIVQILTATGEEIGSARTNALGAFIVSVPSGDYVVHIKTVDFPRCPEEKVIVGPHFFTLVTLTCDTGLR